MTAKKSTKTSTKKVTHKKVEASTPDEITNGSDEPVATVTDASAVQSPLIAAPQPEPVEVADKKYTFDIAMPSTLVPIMKDAWNEVRGKGDAVYDECAPAFRETLLAHTISVLTTHAVLRGDTCLAKFEQEVASMKASKIISK
jgi:hypothetical protein